jgi:hypothetical protein
MANDAREAWKEFGREWFGLPLSLRQRWWEETDYSKKPPSEELLQVMREAVREKTDGK